MQGGTETWSGGGHTVSLDPVVMPFALWRVRPASEG